MTVTMEIPSPFLLQEKEHFIQKKRKRRKAAAHVDYPGLKKKKKSNILPQVVQRSGVGEHAVSYMVQLEWEGLKEHFKNNRLPT